MNQSNRLRRGLTFIEMMVTVAILGLVAVLTVPKLMEAFAASRTGVAQSLQTELQRTYNNWASIGGSHTSTAGWQLTYDLLNHLESAPEQNVDTSVRAVTFADSSGIEEVRLSSPNAGSVRTELPKDIDATPADEDADAVVYDKQYLIKFTPIAIPTVAGRSRSGTWTVVARDN